MSVLITVRAPKRWLFLIKSICLFQLYPHVVFLFVASLPFAYRNMAALTCRLLKSGWLVAGVGARPCAFWTGPDAAHTQSVRLRYPFRFYPLKAGVCQDVVSSLKLVFACTSVRLSGPLYTTRALLAN